MIERGSTTDAPPALPRDQARSLQDIIASALHANNISDRTRAMFALKANGSELARQKLEDVMQLDRSALVRHEAAYLIGQMRQPGALPKLTSTVCNLSEHPMVRHEAAEALGAIGDARALPLLREYATAPDAKAPAEVRETCLLAAARIEWLAGGGDPAAHSSAYSSVDPAPPAERRDVTALGAILRDNTADLYERYRAMFALREVGTATAVAELCAALVARDAAGGDALLRHEIAFVLGQIADPASIEALSASLADTAENEMVRHEAAEAIGAIGSESCRQILAKFQTDPVDVVRESILVALDIADHNAGDDLHYAPIASKNC